MNCEEISSITYTFTYVGEAVQPQIEEPEEEPVREIIPKPEETPAESETHVNTESVGLYVVGGLLIVLLAAAAVYFLRYRKNGGVSRRGTSRKE